MRDLLWGDCPEKRAAICGGENLDLDRLCPVIFPKSHRIHISAPRLIEICTADTGVIKRRQEIVSELLRNKKLYDTLNTFLEKYAVMKEYVYHDFGTNEDMIDNLAGANMITDLLTVIEDLKTAIGRQTGLPVWLEKIGEMIDDIFNELKVDVFKPLLDQKMPNIDHTIGYTLGVNLNETLEAEECQFMSMSSEKEDFKKRSDSKRVEHEIHRYQYGIFKNPTMLSPYSSVMNYNITVNKDENNYAYYMPHVLSLIVRDLTERLKDESRRYIKTVVTRFGNFVEGLSFYLSAADLARRWGLKGIKWCLPEPGENGIFTAANLYSPELLEKLNTDEIVPNDVSLNREIGMITGTNEGGKTVYIRSVLLAQFLYQLGFPIPAESAQISAADSIVAVFAQEELGAIGSGRLGEELKQLSTALDQIKTGNCFFCFNEPLTATSSYDSIVIMSNLLLTLQKSAARGLWVTHLLKLAAAYRLFNDQAGGSKIKSLIAVVEGSGDAVKPGYKIIEGEAAVTSYAKQTVARHT